ncbi:MAG: PP2C family protein-serine/threonine phosphatase [Bdellovibrionota bacterium]
MIQSKESPQMEPAAITDVGCERALNEDRYASIHSPSGTTWLVCDGMGGTSGGDLAAQLAIDAIRRDLQGQSPRPPAVSIEHALMEANRIVVLRRQNQAFAQMGTTATAVQMLGTEIAIANVGDSRAYLIRDGSIRQLTVDHTYVQELVEKGELGEEEALSHPQAHILTRCLGAEPGIKIDLMQYWLTPPTSEVRSSRGDVLLLCSDGLYSLVEDGEIASLVASCAPSEACEQLVALAKERGGFDNITLVVIPLSGELSSQPPSGYSSERMLQKLQKASERTVAIRMRAIVQSVVVIGILSLIAALTAGIAIALRMKV